MWVASILGMSFLWRGAALWSEGSLTFVAKSRFYVKG